MILFKSYFCKKSIIILYIITFFSTVKSINILFIVGSFPHLSQVFILDQIVECIKKGHNIRIHAFKKPRHQKVQKEIVDYNLLERVTYGEKFPVFSSFDIVYVQFGFHGKKVIKEAHLQEYKKPIVVCFRGNDLSGYIQKDPHFYDQLFKDVDLFLPVCDFFAKRLVLLGCDLRKIIVHHSAIDIDSFIFRYHVIDHKTSLRLISVSRLTEKKGLEFSIKAVAKLKNRYPNLKYIIVGDADYHNPGYKEYLKQLVIDLDLEKTVFFYGWATHEEIIPLLSKSDIFILPSITGPDGDQEGIANALKEAMAVGLPVIATDHAGTSELVEHEQTGLLVEEKDVLGIVKAVHWYIKHPEKVKDITKKARIKIEDEFAIKPTVAKLEKIFEQLIDQKKKEYAHV